MNRVVLDTNVIVSALLVPPGTQGAILLLALRGHFALYVSPSVLAEYDEVLRRPRLKLQPRQIDAALAAIRRVAHLVGPVQTVSASGIGGKVQALGRRAGWKSARHGRGLIIRNVPTVKAVRLALEVLQKTERGTNRADSLVKPRDLSRGRRSAEQLQRCCPSPCT